MLEVAVEHGLAADVVAEGHPLGGAVVVLEVGAVDGSDERLAQVQLVDLQRPTASVTQKNRTRTSPLPSIRLLKVGITKPITLSKLIT